MTDCFGRTINYLRISVTDRCNLRCVYCMPTQGIRLIAHNDILTYDEITAFTTLAVSKGVHKVRITGGEPLVRKDLEQLIFMLSKIEGITDLSLTTNGQLLAQKASQLKSAGLQRVNISLDTLDPELYTQITRGGSLEQTLAGIRAAQQADLNPIKLNCVIGINHEKVERRGVLYTPIVEENQKDQIHQFAQKEGLEVRFIHRMSLTGGHFSVVEGASGGDCAHCNRLRLTANGMLKPCLFSDLAYNIREMGYAEALEAALQNKPLRGAFNLSGTFYGIGG